MKKTIICYPEHEDKMIALMDKIGFTETSRYMTGGQTSAIQSVITFEGLAVNYHENDYVVVKANEHYNHYYSLRVPDGNYLRTDEEFKVYHDKKSIKVEIRSFANTPHP